MKRKLAWLLSALLMIGLDRAVKIWAYNVLRPLGTMPLIPGVLRLYYVENTGMAFGLFPGARFILVGLTSAAIIVMIWVLLRKKNLGALLQWSLVFLVGGAVGNLIDRAWKGYVVDMFDFTFVNFAVFNVADIFVTCGGVMLFVYLLFFGEGRKGREKARDSEI